MIRFFSSLFRAGDLLFGHSLLGCGGGERVAADFYLLQLNSIQLLNDECIVLFVFIIIYLFV